ncbi:AAA family ATPase, partial [Staphylococcus chromogenes]
MTEVITDLKALKLHGMAQAYGELLEQGGSAALQASHWLI